MFDISSIIDSLRLGAGLLVAGQATLIIVIIIFVYSIIYRTQ